MDSTGRNRLFARTLEIPSQAGPRTDVAHFAHYAGFEENQPRGQVIIGWLERGWNWRIPLQDRLSVGVVMHRDEAAKLGATPEERLENAIARDPVLSAAGRDRRRVSEVATYTNYQLISERGHGPGWVMTGRRVRVRRSHALARVMAGAAFGGTADRTPRRSPGLLARDAPATQGVDGNDRALLQRADFCDVPQGRVLQPQISDRLLQGHPIAFRHDGRLHGVWRDDALAVWTHGAESFFEPRRLGTRQRHLPSASQDGICL